MLAGTILYYRYVYQLFEKVLFLSRRVFGTKTIFVTRCGLLLIQTAGILAVCVINDQPCSLEVKVEV